MPLAAHHPMLAGPKCHHCLCLHHSSLLAPWLVIGFVRLATKVGEMAGISGHQLCHMELLTLTCWGGGLLLSVKW